MSQSAEWNSRAENESQWLSVWFPWQWLQSLHVGEEKCHMKTSRNTLTEMPFAVLIPTVCAWDVGGGLYSWSISFGRPRNSSSSRQILELSPKHLELNTAFGLARCLKDACFIYSGPADERRQQPNCQVKFWKVRAAEVSFKVTESSTETVNSERSCKPEPGMVYAAQSLLVCVWNRRRCTVVSSPDSLYDVGVLIITLIGRQNKRLELFLVSYFFKRTDSVSCILSPN